MAEIRITSQRNVPTTMSNPDKQYDEAVKLKDKGDLGRSSDDPEGDCDRDPDAYVVALVLAVYLQKSAAVMKKAIQHAIKVTELDPKDPFSFTQLSVIYVRCGKIQEAEDAKAKAHELTGGHHH